MHFTHKKIHFVGIEGAGTSALAVMLARAGHEVTGSDEGDHFYADVLKEEGIEVADEFMAANIDNRTNLVVYSTAYNFENNVELIAAREMRKKTMSYPEALGHVFNKKYGIAVCGTHGKTTTSAWLAFVLKQANMDPSAIIGSKVGQLGGNSLTGKSDYFILEADEYQNKLRYYKPRMALINNIDYDHPDFFRTVDEYQHTFIEFMKNIPKKGLLVVNFDDPFLYKTAEVNCRGRVASYAINNTADYVAYNIKTAANRTIFSVKLGNDEIEADDVDYGLDERELGEFSISLFGSHNVSNALAVIVTCVELGLDLADIRRFLEDFTGTARRMQVMGSKRGALIMDDYAHHPTEIKATLKAVRGLYPDKRIITVFHPHTFTRTKALLKDFAKSFDLSDETIILDIFGSAREKQGTVHSRDLVDAIHKHNPGTSVKNISDLKTCGEKLRAQIGKKDLLLLMGAGDVYKIGEKLLD